MEENQKAERRTKTVYLTDDMLRQWHDSGHTIGDIFRAGLAATAPLVIPEDLTKAVAVLGDVLTKLAAGWTLVPPEPDHPMDPEGGPGEPDEEPADPEVLAGGDITGQ